MKEFNTIDGKWWLFDGEKKIRPLTDMEAAQVIWGRCNTLITAAPYKDSHKATPYLRGCIDQRIMDGYCLECGLYKPEDERVQNGMKCGQCAY